MNAFSGSLHRRWPAFALIASLVLNGFLICMMVTDSLKPRRSASGERFARFELRRLADRLPETAVDQIADDLQPLAPDIAERVARLRALRAEIMQLAAIPNPDRSAIDERLSALRAEASSMQEEVQRATYDALLDLPPETRARLAEAAE